MVIFYKLIHEFVFCCFGHTAWGVYMEKGENLCEFFKINVFCVITP